MKKTTLSLELARKIALNHHGLSGTEGKPSGKDRVMEIIRRAGYIQIDSMSVIQRAHHHVLWTRLPDYQPQLLHELHARDRQVFEYFARAASYLPMDNYRYFLPRMQRFDDPIGKWEKNRKEKCGHLMQPILERIRAEGPLASKNFETPPISKRNGTINWKPARQALDLLALTGALMVKERHNFQKIYDLTERVLPAKVNLQMPTADELGEFAVLSALTAMGIAREKEIYNYLLVAPKKHVTLALHNLCEMGKVTPVCIEPGNKETHYVFTETLQNQSELSLYAGKVHILSPFDNLIIFRDRANLLFQFDYTLESYVPPEKRQYGYLVHPVVWGDRFVARMDPAVDKKKQNLVIHSLHFEPAFTEYEQFLPAFVHKCFDLAVFNGCHRITLENTFPADKKTLVQKHFNL